MRRIALSAFLLAGCGVTSHNFYLYDLPPAGVTEVLLYVAAVEAHIDDDRDAHAPDDDSIDADGKWRRLEVDRVIDLVAAEGVGNAAQLGELGIPNEGRISQIRLQLDLSQPQKARFNGTRCDLDTSQVNAQGVKINHAFKAIDAQQGNHQDLYLHLDLRASMDPSGDPAYCFVLAPHLELGKVLVDGANHDLGK